MRRLAPFLLALAAASCGRKLAPQAPLQVLPARIAPVAVSQEGSDVVVRFPYPSRTNTGETLTGLTRITVYRDVAAAPPGAQPPAPPEEGAQREREEKQFLLKSQKLHVLDRAGIDEATVGSEIVLRDSLVPLFLEKRLGRVFLRYGVTATRDKKRVSELSPLVALLPRVPPGDPTDLTAVVEEKRVCLDWKRPGIMLDGGKPVVVAGYAVYRRDASEDMYDQPLAFATQGAFFIDETVVPNRQYVYTVRAAPTKDRPLVLGPPSDEVPVDTKDVFPPPSPDGLLVLSEPGGSRLVWNPVLVPDLAGYYVYRFEAGTWQRISDRLTDPSYADAGARPDARYAVSAVDKSGNESPRAEVTSGRGEGTAR